MYLSRIFETIIALTALTINPTIPQPIAIAAITATKSLKGVKSPSSSTEPQLAGMNHNIA